MEPVNFLQSSSLGINQEFVTLVDQNEVKDPLAFDNDFDCHEEQTSNPTDEEQQLEEIIIINEDIDKDIYTPKTETQDPLKQIEQVEIISDMEDIYQENDDDERKIDFDQFEDFIEVAEQLSTTEALNQAVEYELRTEAGISIMCEELPKLIPIQSKRQEDEVPVEMPSLIPITKHNNRLHMAQLIERKLQSEIEDYNYIDMEVNNMQIIGNQDSIRETNIVEETEILVRNQQELHDNVEIMERCLKREPDSFESLENDCSKIPLIGSVCKSERKTCRLTKPPWLMEIYNENEKYKQADEEIEVNDENGEDAQVDEGGIEVSNGMDMREKLCSQLKMLKGKRKTEPLFQTNIPNFSNVHYEKRIIKPSPVCLNLATEISSPLGIKIVAVAGGVDMDTCSELMSLVVPKGSHESEISSKRSDIFAQREQDIIQVGGEAINKNAQEGEKVMVKEEECLSDGLADTIAENEEAMEIEDNASQCTEIENSPVKEVIINEHLDQPTIKLTKTKDYKKIKGWNKKKLLTLDEEPQDAASLSQQEDQDPKPGCSYLIDNKTDEPKTDKPELISSEETNNIFASNSLDGFLEEKDLNISYNVPNLKSTNHNINLLDDCILVAIEQEKKLRPKLEIDDSTSNSSFKEVYKPRTLAEKRKMLLEEKDGVEQNKKSKYTNNKEKKFSRRPYSIKYDTGISIPSKEFNGTKVHVHDDDNESLLIPLLGNIPNVVMEDENSADVVYVNVEQSKPKNCVTSKVRFRSNQVLTPYSVVTRKPITRILCQKYQDIKRKFKYDLVPKSRGGFIIRHKPSILKSSESPVVYRPGPLCKKLELQVNGCKDWETVLVDLPKVEVAVTPQLGKKIHPRVRQFVKFESFDITEDRINFALSALISRKNEGMSFRFPARYKHKQEKIMMRRTIVKKPKVEPKLLSVSKNLETEADILNNVKIVIGKMLDYAEVKELESSLLNFDGDVQCKTDADTEPLEMTKQRKYLDKPSRELRRLNVRIVNLPNEEKTDKSATCTNLFCKFGCVCQSISNKYPPFNHCGEAKCIFACVCGFEAKCKFNACKKEDLDEGTLSRFSKEAKRNITAREEREFTQTAIRSNNNTIILGNNRINKRRPKYNFKRFEGFQFSFTDDKIPKKHENAWMFEDDKMLMSDWKLYNSSVAVVRCNFDDIVPFCLAHNLYDCHCGGKAEYKHCEQSKVSRKASFVPFATQESENDTAEVETSDKIVRKTPKPIPTGIQIKTNENIVDNVFGRASRIRGIGEYYRIRNNTNKYKNTMARKLKYDTTVNSDIVNKWIILPPDRNLIEKRKSHQPQIEKSSAKDKDSSSDTIDIDLDSEDNPKIKARNKGKQIIEQTKTPNLKSIAARLTISGALYTPTAAMRNHFSQMIAEKSGVCTEFRLLMWLPLVKLYDNNFINIWYCNKNNKLRFIITDCLTNPLEYFVNIKNFHGMDKNEIKVDFIKWIVTKSMPENKRGDNILVILKILKNYWEIFGICAKNKNESASLPTSSELEKSEKSSNSNSLKVISDSNCTGERRSDSNSDKVINSISLQGAIHTVNEKYYKTVRQVMFSNGTFASKQLQLVESSDRLKGEACMLAALPHILKNCRWRVLKVNSNFAILSFVKKEFSIKCSDILTVMKVSSKYNKTIIINTKTIAQNYKHKAFGIYIPSTYQDRIFIGPYVDDEEHGIETLRFVNNKLVDTEVFNTMRGIRNMACTGLWYAQVGRVSEPNQVQESVSADSVIDLTDMEEVRKVMQSSDVTITPSPKSVSSKILAKRAKLKSTFVPHSKSKNSDNTSSIVLGSDDKTNHEMDKNVTVTVQKSTDIFPQGSNQHLAPRLLIPKISADNKVTYNEVMINIAPGVNFPPSKGFGNTRSPIGAATLPNVPNISTLPAIANVQKTSKGLLKKSTTPIRLTKPDKPTTMHKNKMPELIKLSLNPNKTNKNITNVNVNENMDDLMDVATLENIIDQAKAAGPVRREYLFNMRLKVIMKQMNINMPQQAKPICFRLNFGNGVILGYEDNSVVHVFWPGDCKREFEFDNIEDATSWLKQELHAVFICIPTTFKIEVTPIGASHYLEYINRGIISQKYFKEICIIGDFGIMRLAEAQPYLLYNDRDTALKHLLAVNSKPNKFKKAMAQIIAANDMSKAGFQRKVSNLIAKAKAAADDFAQLKATDPLALIGTAPPILTAESPSAQLIDEVICLDSDSDNDSDSNSNNSSAVATITNPYNRTFERLQKRLSLPNTLPKTKSKKKKRSSDLADIVKRNNIMEIDLTHMTTEKVKAMLLGNQFGTPIAVTKDQVKKLKAMSQQNGAFH